jgi:hypothetical protein
MIRRNKAQLTISFTAGINKLCTSPFIFNLQSSPKRAIFSRKEALTWGWRGGASENRHQHDSYEDSWEGPGPLSRLTPELFSACP